MSTTSHYTYSPDEVAVIFLQPAKKGLGIPATKKMVNRVGRCFILPFETTIHPLTSLFRMLAVSLIFGASLSPKLNVPAK